MNESDPQLHRVGDVVDLHRLTIHKNFTFVRLIHPAEDFHQGGFARAVLAAKREHFALADFEAHVVQSDHTGESFGDSAHREKRRRVHFRPSK